MVKLWRWSNTVDLAYRLESLLLGNLGKGPDWFFIYSKPPIPTMELTSESVAIIFSQGVSDAD